MVVSFPTILLIEDDPWIGNATKCDFNLDQWNVLYAGSITKAREILRETEPDLILMETVLPDGDGIMFCKELYRETDAKIVFYTSKDLDDGAVKGFRAGASDYIRKPCDKQLLLTRVGRCLPKYDRPLPTSLQTYAVSPNRAAQSGSVAITALHSSPPCKAALITSAIAKISYAICAVSMVLLLLCISFNWNEAFFSFVGYAVAISFLTGVFSLVINGTYPDCNGVYNKKTGQKEKTQ